ncbi:MAG: 7,8-didemethyl-8-hydroxy-5-deazariboflavin synthase subunit CofH [Candidatus Methanoliparum thermophilum]|uniref:5-amino-6-(D-ribitylamino)uracil--L-tyrosine 4-hydroxyphenyl transferase n=2 Tax=Candidatus Methanoliparum TaxID=2545692 RepID=A0A520KS99_METT2|nr:MAG: 7,8-didemethyl-8-hydroxy-5-deazariboflavin synthase subunit CofH [Candidatus Methanoliparum thermophilum]
MGLKKNEIDELIDKAWKGNLERNNVIALYNVNPIILFQLADSMRKKVVGDYVTYVINRNINFTDICIDDCAFCSFRYNEGYILSIEEILAKADEAVERGATEVCIQGGLLEGMGLEDYKLIVTSIKDRFPSLHIHAFSPMEVYHAARTSEMDFRDVLKELKKAGLGSMPGTAAEILVDSVRSKICPHKISSDKWEEIIKEAHRYGIPTTSTIMYGHIESIEDRIDHILRIKRIQKETGGFTEFVLLPFMSKNNALGRIADKRSGIDDMKMHAISRVLLYNVINNIQASWVKLGLDMAQLSLLFGVNDLGGTLMEEKISKSSGSEVGEYLSPEDMEKLILKAGRIPRRRDTLYFMV